MLLYISADASIHHEINCRFSIAAVHPDGRGEWLQAGRAKMGMICQPRFQGYSSALLFGQHKAFGLA